ncbi:hypothetical protein VP01_728g1 [Puccinia sorghi]|uniref:Uncharacterized protein n=1 Tax=Puccinia sorghi TaxID=27349 RepID=A0A0L6UD07_9BASI|nr:hypothetical protein VP01_728g1 [Puccinia sorghi]
MQLSLHLICLASCMINFSASLPVPTPSGLKTTHSSSGRTHHLYTLMRKVKPFETKRTKAGLTRGTSVPKSQKKSSGVAKKKRIDNYAHLKHIFKGQYRSLLYKPTPQVITPEIAAIRRSIALRMLGKRSPTDSTLATLLGTATSTAGSLPVVGVPLTSLLSSLPTSAVSSPGAVTGLLGSLTGAAQSAPVLGDLIKILPLSSILKGNPLDNLKSSLSAIFVAIPVLGGPLNGLTGAASSAASSLPISLFDSRYVSPASSQRTVTEPETNEDPSPSTPLAAILGRSLKSGRFITAREH